MQYKLVTLSIFMFLPPLLVGCFNISLFRFIFILNTLLIFVLPPKKLGTSRERTCTVFVPIFAYRRVLFFSDVSNVITIDFDSGHRAAYTSSQKLLFVSSQKCLCSPVTTRGVTQIKLQFQMDQLLSWIWQLKSCPALEQ